jgi:hypothetical protein
MKQDETFRRIMTKDGWIYYCRKCGVYKPESEFNKRRRARFGVNYFCREHKPETKSDHDPKMDYLKLQSVKQSDYYQRDELLRNLGYEVGEGHPPVWFQFNKRYNL